MKWDLFKNNLPLCGPIYQLFTFFLFFKHTPFPNHSNEVFVLLAVICLHIRSLNELNFLLLFALRRDYKFSRASLGLLLYTWLVLVSLIFFIWGIVHFYKQLIFFTIFYLIIYIIEDLTLWVFIEHLKTHIKSLGFST